MRIDENKKGHSFENESICP